MGHYSTSCNKRKISPAVPVKSPRREPIKLNSRIIKYNMYTGQKLDEPIDILKLAPKKIERKLAETKAPSRKSQPRKNTEVNLPKGSGLTMQRFGYL